MNDVCRNHRNLNLITRDCPPKTILAATPLLSSSVTFLLKVSLLKKKIKVVTSVKVILLRILYAITLPLLSQQSQSSSSTVIKSTSNDVYHCFRSCFLNRNLLWALFNRIINNQASLFHEEFVIASFSFFAQMLTDHAVGSVKFNNIPTTRQMWNKRYTEVKVLCFARHLTQF